MSKWKDQLARAERYLERFNWAFHRNLSPQEVQTAIDDLYSSFIHCWHVKDYLIVEKVFPKQQVEAFANTPNSPLDICGDIANGLKHCVNKPAAFGQQLVRISVEDGGSNPASPTARIGNMEIISGGQSLEAAKVAADAISAWKVFTHFVC